MDGGSRKRGEERSAALLLFPHRGSRRRYDDGKSETSVNGVVHIYKGYDVATREFSAVESTGGGARCRIRSTGTFAVLDAERARELTPRGRKARAILAYLSSRRACRASREELIELLWGDRGEAQARASLRQSLLEIRQACGDLVEADRERVWIDEARLAPEEEDAGAGEAFANLNNITPECDAWLRSERDRRAGKAWDGLRREIEALLARDRGAEVTPLVERMRQIDPYNEDWVRLAMQAEFQGGHPAAIDRYFNDIEALLRQDLGVAPANETRALRDRLLAELTRAPAVIRESAVDLPAHQPIHLAPVSRRTVLAGGAVAVTAAAGVGVWMRFRPSSAVASNRIAVLPFANLSGDPSQAYFSDGLAEELRTALSRIPQLKIVARTSSEIVRDDDVRTAARKLGVGSIITGSVRRSPSTIRVDAQLIDGNDGIERWSEAYSRPAGDVFQVQADIAQKVASALRLQFSLGTEASLTIGGTINPTAHDLLLQADRDRNADNQASIERGLALLNAALALDPNYAEAYARKSFLLTVKAATYTQTAAASNRGQAEALATVNRSIAIAPRMAFGYSVRSVVHEQRLQFRLAWADARRALDLPGGDNVFVLGNYAYILSMIGRSEEALRLSDKVIALDPLNPGSYGDRAVYLYGARRYSESITTARRALQQAPSSDYSRFFLGDALLTDGKPAEAEAEYRKLAPAFYRRLLGEAVIAARAGRRSVALDKLRTMQARYGDVAHYQYGEIYAQLGLIKDAFRELELAWDVRDPGLARLRVDPFLDPIRADPRFAAFEQKLGFP